MGIACYLDIPTVHDTRKGGFNCSKPRNLLVLTALRALLTQSKANPLGH